MKLAELDGLVVRKLHIGYTLIKIIVHFPCFKNNADILAYAGLRVKTKQTNMQNVTGSSKKCYSPTN